MQTDTSTRREGLTGSGAAQHFTYRHLGSAPWPVTSSGRSAASSDAMIPRHSSSDEHFGFSVFSRVTPWLCQPDFERASHLLKEKQDRLPGSNRTHHLIPDFGPLVRFQRILVLRKVVLEQIDEPVIRLPRRATVPHDQRTRGD
jgi:hypothetical protein